MTKKTSNKKYEIYLTTKKRKKEKKRKEKDKKIRKRDTNPRIFCIF